MPLDLGTLRSAGSRSRYFTSASNSQNARMLGYKTAFLCHSHKDRTAVEGVLKFFKDQGLHLYVDWMDSEMPESTNGNTARMIKNRIVEADLFFFLATPNALASRWCPWEIGYADGVKNYDSIFVIPTKERGITYGNEYVDIYRRIDESQEGHLAAWYPGRHKDGIVARSL
ncbi:MULTISPECIES: toll/interleukin-1 receptor domain-containing protein [Pseudomonas syringae group]|uniref:toll/interleukin-1 receptor domain-containing protein n=1 Tax=Pseudomonas syringae group TaxID=136849 RepID=UPI0013036D98|nr:MULTISPECIES: toll/interleukin-1 receptor domain-containing protein [Pseudomonas syringae group]MCF5199892.1 TIR domain-containing protein [Pseudomonas syringae]MCF5209305.1 TIR domain-containing protein [Pseudomonas syringae]MCF5214950.1 TIR domain-containing protein [Pseudomonas syringae]MCF5218376.1 TIR domain-containing protein [Pseudomonas syringae]MCF5268007.1 TIR domain-containing protein [Pseudomonas syringae]